MCRDCPVSCGTRCKHCRARCGLSKPPIVRKRVPQGSCCLQGHATSDHTTLLLNCYSKLKDIQKLEAFLRRTGATGDNATLQFDTEVAVKVHMVQCQLPDIATVEPLRSCIQLHRLLCC